MVHVYGLREEVLGPELHGAHRGLAVPLSGEEDDRAAPRLELLEHAQPPDVGKVRVEDYDVGTHAIERLEAGLAGGRARDLVPDPVQVVTEHAQQVGVGAPTPGTRSGSARRLRRAVRPRPASRRRGRYRAAAAGRAAPAPRSSQPAPWPPAAHAQPRPRSRGGADSSRWGARRTPSSRTPPSSSGASRPPPCPP